MSTSPIIRESRHVLVTGLPEIITEDKIHNFFQGFGRVQKIERCAEGVVVSFADVRSALKAHNGAHKLETGQLFQLSFFTEASPTSKNPLSQQCLSKPDAASPRIVDGKTNSSSPRSIKEIRGQRPLNAPSSKRSMRPELLRKDGRPDSSSSGSPCSSGLSGFYVENIPREAARNAIGEALKKFGKLAYVLDNIGNSDENRRALVIFNSVSEKAVDKAVMIVGQRCRVRQAETMDVQMAYNRQLAAAGAMAASTSRDGFCGGRDEVTVNSENASRTLYVGGLESNPTEASLRRRFDKFGHILDLDVKNPESPSPFAFLQFADIDSAVRAINAYRQNPMGVKKLKVNFGRLQVSSRLWIGAVPPSASEDYVKQKLKALLDGATDVFYDTNIHQAIVTFGSNEHATRSHDKIRKGICQLKCDGQEFRLSVDYCSERLLNFFLDRKHQQASSYLSPPPNPPAEMPSYPSNGYRHDHYRDGRRASPSYSRRHDRSRSRDRSERSRSRHIPSKYERKRSRDDHRRRRESSDSSSSDSSSSGSSGSSKRSSSRSRSEYSSPEQYKSSKGGSRREERRERERTERKPHRKRPAVESPAAVVEKVEEVPPRRPVERVEGQPAQERAQSGDSGFSEEQRGALEPPPAPPAIGETVKPPPPQPPHPQPVRQSSSTSSHHATPPQRQEQHREHHNGAQQQQEGSSQQPHGAPQHHHSHEHHHGQQQPHHSGHQPQQQPQQRHHQDGRPQQQAGAVRPHYPHEHISKRPSFDGHTMRDHYGNDVMNRHEQRQHHVPLPYSYYPGTTRVHGANNFAPKDALYSYPTNWPFLILATNRPLRIPYDTIRGAKLVDPRKKRPHRDFNPNNTYRREWETFMQLPAPKDVPKEVLDQLTEPDQYLKMMPGPWLEDKTIQWEVITPPKKKEEPKKEEGSGQVSRGTSQDEPPQQQPHQGHSSQHPSQQQHHGRRSPPPPHDHAQPSTSQHGGVPTTPGFTPTTPASGHEEEGSRVSRSNSQSSWMPTGKDMYYPGTPQRPGFAERMLKLKDNQSKGKVLTLSGGSASGGGGSGGGGSGGGGSQGGGGSAGGSGNFAIPPSASPAPRQNLHIQIPPTGSNYPGTPNSAKSCDFSPRVDNVRKTASALPANSRAPFTPNLGPASSVPFPPNTHIPPPNFNQEYQQPSPILSAPPPPPQLPPIRTDVGLKSPPMTPGSTSSSKYGVPSSAPSPSVTANRTPIHDFSKGKEPLHSAPRPVQPSSRHPSMSAMPKPQERPPYDRPPPPVNQRHDSMSALRSPPAQPASLVARSQSMSDSKKSANMANKDTSELLQHLFTGQAPAPSPMSSMKSFKIEKKPQQQPQQVEKQQEKEKHKKEHKQRRKEDGTLETKEERAKRKEMERAQKEKLKRKKEKREKLERKRSKEGGGGEEKERKKHKKEKREKEEKKAKKKKKKHHKQSSEEEENSEESEEEGYQKSFMRQQYQSDHQLAMALAGQSMYDRVKRRSSAATKDEAKKSALQALREKNKKIRGRVLLDSSDEDESSQQRGSDDNSSDDNEPLRKTESAESGREEEEPVHKIKRKKLKPIKEASKEDRGSSDSESEHEHRKHKKAKKKEKLAKKNAFADSDIFRADSSEDEQVAKKKLLSTSDESDHPKKQKIDFHDLFGSDNVEKKAKKEKRDKSPKHRKRHLSSTGDEAVAKRSKRGSMGSEMSSDAEAVLAKLQELRDEPKKQEEVVVEEAQVPACSIFTAPISEPVPPPPVVVPKENHHERPRLVTKAAMKVFEPAAPLPPVSQSIIERASEVDSDDSAAHCYPHSRDSSSSSEGSDSEAPAPQCLSPPPQEEEEKRPDEEEEDMEEGELVEDEEEVVEEEEHMDVCPAPPPQPILEPPPPEPEVVEDPQPQLQEHQLALDEECEKAALSIAEDQETENAVQSIFDDCEEDTEPQYPSHDFIHNDEAVLIDPIPVEISEDQIMAESFVEEPMPVEEEAEEEPKIPDEPLLEEGEVKEEVEEEKPEPQEAFYHQEPLKEPPKEEPLLEPSPLSRELSICVDPLPVATATPLPSSSFNGSADSLTSPRLPATPQSAPVAASPLASPAVPAASPAGRSPRATAPPPHQQPLPSPVASPRVVQVRRCQEQINLIDGQLRQMQAAQVDGVRFVQGENYHSQVVYLENMRKQYLQEIQNIQQASVPPQQQPAAPEPSPDAALDRAPSYLKDEEAEDPSSKTPFLKLQAVLNMQPNADQSMIFNLASAIAMQSLLNMNQNNPLLASAAKLMLNMGSLLPANQEEAGSSGANPLSTLQSTLLLQQYAAMARQGANQANPQLASLHMSLKRNSEPTPRKRSLPLDPAEEIRCKLMPLDDTGRVPMSKEDFDDCLDTVLREELGEESDEPKDDSPLASQSSVTTDDDVKELSEVDSPPKELSLRDILDFNWSESSDIASAVSAFRKVRSEPGQVSHHGSVDSVDWATSISPAGNSPAPEPELAPLSSEMLERIRLVAQSMLRRQGDQEPLSLGDQMERMPSIWRGKIVIKNSTEVAVQMHMMCGEKDYVTGALGPLAAGMRTKSGGEPSLRILQRMRAEGQALYSLLLRLQTSGSTCLCVPIGNSKEEMKQHSMLLKQAFSDYFVRKGCAGIVSVDATETTPASLLYVFPPNEFTDAYLAECSPQLLSKLKNKESEDFCYLFVAIAPAVLPQQD